MTRPATSRRRYRTAAALLAASAVVLGAAGGPAAIALWSARVTVSGTVTAAEVGAAAGFAPPTATIANESRTQTALVTITNTTSGSTTVPADVVAELSVPTAIDPGIIATAWPVQDAGECTDAAVAPADAATGPWTDGLSVPVTPLAPGAQAELCVRTTGSAQAFGVAAGTQTFTPTIGATLSVHAFSASATASATYTTRLIFRVAIFPDGRVQQIRPDGDRTLCMDAGDALGDPVALAPCVGSTTDPGPNQFFVWNTVAPDFSTLTAGRAAGGLVTIDPDGSLTTRAAGAPGVQTWQIQVSQGNSVFQIVSGSGLCWTAPAGPGPMTAAVCDGSEAQQWVSFAVSTGTAGTVGG